MGAPGEPTGAQLGMSSKEGDPNLLSLPQVDAWLQQGEELGDVLPPRSPSCSPQLFSVPLGYALLHLHYHLPVMNFVPILLPTASYQPHFLQFLTLTLHFPLLNSSASVAGSAMSPLYPIFQIIVFTAGP